MQPEQRERHPVTGQHLDVRQLRHPVWREAECHAGNDAGIVPLRDFVRQQVRRQSAEREAEEERDVVSEQRVSRRLDDGRGEQRNPEQMLRERHRPGRGMKLWQVPPALREGELAGVPGEQEDVQQWIAKVAWHPAAGVQHERPREYGCQDEIQSCGTARCQESLAHRRGALYCRCRDSAWSRDRLQKHPHRRIAFAGGDQRERFQHALEL